MKNKLIKNIQSVLNTFTDLPITFVEMGIDSVIHSNTVKNGLKLIERINHSTVTIVTYRYGLPVNDETLNYTDLTTNHLKQIESKLNRFNKDLNDKVLIDLVDSIIN